MNYQKKTIITSTTRLCTNVRDILSISAANGHVTALVFDLGVFCWDRRYGPQLTEDNNRLLIKWSSYS